MRSLHICIIVVVFMMFICSASAAQSRYVTDEAGSHLAASVPSDVSYPAIKAFKQAKEAHHHPLHRIHRAHSPQGEARVHSDLHRKNMGGQSAVARALRARGIKIDQ